MDLGLTDKVAIITGASDGIGKAAARRIAAEGGTVLIIARTESTLNAAADELNQVAKGIVVPVVGDVCDPNLPEKVVKEALSKFGKIDILVNNAGRSMAKHFDSVSDTDWEEDFDLKVWGAVRLIRAVIPEMRKNNGGRIINVTNLGGRTPGPASMPTSISRATGIAITKALSKDLASDNILVNTVCIGLVKSGQHDRRYEALDKEEYNLTLDEYYEQLGQRVPIGRVAESEEAGDVIAFLASERASYLTGIAINIDGGTSAVL